MFHLPALLFYSVLSLLFLRQLLPMWSIAIPGGLEDTRLFLWNAWWFRYAIDTLHQSPFFTTLLFHPFGTSLISHDFPLWTNLVTYIGQACGLNFVAASNVWFILSWILAGFCSYLLVWEVARSRAAAIVSGLYVMTHSYTLARAMQNWGQFNLWGIAFFLWLLVRAHRLGRKRDYILAGAALAWTAACHYYFLIYSGAIWLAVAIDHIWPCQCFIARGGTFKKLFLLPAAIVGALAAYIMVVNPGMITIGQKSISMHTPTNVLLVMWVSLAAFLVSGFKFQVQRLPVQNDVRKHALKRHTWLIATALLCLTPLIWGTIQIVLQGGYPKQTILWKTHLPGANLLALFGPNPIHAVWGSAVSQWFEHHGMNAQEQAAGIGWVCLGIIVLSRIWKKTQDSVPRTQHWVYLAIASTILAMGTYLHILWINLWLPLPFYFWRLLPVLGNVRVPERWMAVGSIAWGVVLGLALVALVRRKNWPLTKVCVIAGTLILIENWPGIPVGHPTPTAPIYETLRQLPPGGVLPLPLYIGDSSIGSGNAPPGFIWETLGYQTYHHHPLVGGYVGRIQRKLITTYKADPFFRQLIDLEEEKPTTADISREQACDSMKNFDVSYALLYPNALNDTTKAFIQKSLSLQSIQKDADVELFRISCNP